MILFISYSYNLIKNILRNRHNFYNKIIRFEKKQNITQYEIQKFLSINSKNILIDREKYKRNNNPDISIIVTMYNQGHYIHKCLRSIQNQSLKNIEIIIIDDCSLDNSTDIIESYQKEDNRIILVKHESNEGKIKSRTDGIKIAKGKYITIIDGDDAFIHNNILFNSLYISNLANLDIVEFKCSLYRNGTFKGIINNYNELKITNLVYQPELRTKFLYTGIRAQSRNICFKLIKNEIFQKALIYIGQKYTEDYIQVYEDTIMAIAIIQIAESYYLMNQVGYYYSKDEFPTRLPILKNKKCKPNRKIKKIGQLKLLQFLAEKTKNNKNEKQMLYREMIFFHYFTNFSKYIEDMNNLYDIMINSKYISTKQKEKIKLFKVQLKAIKKYI